MNLRCVLIITRLPGLILVLTLLGLLLTACQDTALFTPTNNNAAPTTAAAQTTVSANITSAALTTPSNTTVAQLPTFTPAATQVIATVTPMPSATAVPTTTVAATPTTVPTTEAVTTTTVAPDTTSAPVVITTAPVVTTKAGVSTTKPATTAVAKIASVFNSVMPELRRQKEVAVVLPTYIFNPDASLPLYAIIERSDKPGYSIVLGYTPDCNGGTACRLGTVSGTPSTNGEADLKGTKVTLKNSITGFYNPSTCGANCSDATVTWKQGKGVYSVGIKAGNLDELTKMANSAIVAGQVK